MQPTHEIAPDIASTAALIGDPVRAAMLWSLMDGQLRPAGELAAIGGASPQSASAHLARLVEGGLLAVEPKGRHRFYRLSGPEAATALETLAAMSSAAPGGDRTVSRTPAPLREARRCWGHLAGAVGVRLHDGLLASGWIRADHDRYELTLVGQAGLEKLGLDVSELRAGRRGLAFPCPDWSERRPHLGGPIAGGLLKALLAQGWFQASTGSRQLQVTPLGRIRLRDLLDALSSPERASPRAPRADP